jgi:hypothetical protein
MKLIIQTRVIALMEDQFRDFTTREYALNLGNKLPDLTALERMVHQAKATVEKHRPTLHEHVETWYVIPDDQDPDTNFAYDLNFVSNFK